MGTSNPDKNIVKTRNYTFNERDMMNITRYTLSAALLLSVASASAHDEVTNTPCSHGCTHSSVTVEAVEAVKTVSIDEVLEAAQKDFDLTDAEVAQLRTRLEANQDADIAAIVAEIRTAQADAQAAEKTAEVAQDMI